MAFDTAGAIISHIATQTNIPTASTILENTPYPFCSVVRVGGARRIKGDAPVYLVTVWNKSEVKAWESYSAVRDALLSIRESVPQIGHISENNVAGSSDGNESFWYEGTFDVFTPC